MNKYFSAAKLQYRGKKKFFFLLGLTHCMKVSSIDIKNIVFMTNTKIKIQSSCFPVNCFVVKSVKPDQVISKEGDLILKGFS